MEDCTWQQIVEPAIVLVVQAQDCVEEVVTSLWTPHEALTHEAKIQDCACRVMHRDSDRIFFAHLQWWLTMVNARGKGRALYIGQCIEHT
jgi:hypothetical protein